MIPTLYFDGNQRSIAWVIDTEKESFKEARKHAEYFYDQVSIEQSKYIALHVGIFWGIGRFIIKNDDHVTVMVDKQSMLDQLANRIKTDDPFINSRTAFINQIVNQRNLDISYKIIEPKDNKATTLLSE